MGSTKQFAPRRRTCPLNHAQKQYSPSRNCYYVAYHIFVRVMSSASPAEQRTSNMIICEVLHGKKTQRDWTKGFK